MTYVVEVLQKTSVKMIPIVDHFSTTVIHTLTNDVSMVSVRKKSFVTIPEILASKIHPNVVRMMIVF